MRNLDDIQQNLQLTKSSSLDHPGLQSKDRGESLDSHSDRRNSKPHRYQTLNSTDGKTSLDGARIRSSP